MTWTKFADYVESITLQEGLGAALKWLKDGSCFPVDHNAEDKLHINVSTMFDAQHDSPKPPTGAGMDPRMHRRTFQSDSVADSVN